MRRWKEMSQNISPNTSLQATKESKICLVRGWTVQCVWMLDNPTDMQIDTEGTDYMDEDLMVRMLREEGAHWGLAAIVETITELKNWAQEGATYTMEDSVKKIKTVEPITPAKKIQTVEPITPVKNIASIPIEPVSASIIIPIEFVCDHIPIESVSIESIEKSFLYKRRNPTC